MGKGTFLNQKLGKRTERVQRQRKAKMAAIPPRQKSRRDIIGGNPMKAGRKIREIEER